MVVLLSVKRTTGVCRLCCAVHLVKWILTIMAMLVQVVVVMNMKARMVIVVVGMGMVIKVYRLKYHIVPGLVFLKLVMRECQYNFTNHIQVLSLSIPLR